MKRVIASVFLAALVAVPLGASAARLEAEPVLGSPLERLHLHFPQDPEVTWFVDTYGVVSRGRRHIGLDLHAPKGSPVYAIAPGVVTRMASSPRAGYHLVIDHGSGWTSWYMHLDNDSPGTDDGRGGSEAAFAAGLSEGDFVDAGQLIGHVGDSGNAEATEPHTHFEVHRHGSVVDPTSMLRQAQDRALMALHAERITSLVDRVD